LKTADCIRGAIYGLVTGDALGVPVEFTLRSELKEQPVTDMIGYGTHSQPPGTWSDDSSLALCLADELIKGYHLNNIAASFLKWYDKKLWTPHGEVFDIGGTTRKAILNLKNGVSPAQAGGHNEQSNGNGSLMRILPLLFYVRNIENPLERYNVVREVSGITHAHIRSVLACYYYIEFASFLCDNNGAVTSAYEMTNSFFENLIHQLKPESVEVEKFNRLLSGNLPLLPENEINSGGYVIHTLEASLWCLFKTGSYKEAVLKAINLGGDTDTTACVTGGLAGIIYGAHSIPEEWLQQLAKKDDIENLIERFTEKYT
jgi:ADP-ribosylglycohydrolase